MREKERESTYCEESTVFVHAERVVTLRMNCCIDPWQSVENLLIFFLYRGHRERKPPIINTLEGTTNVSLCHCPSNYVIFIVVTCIVVPCILFVSLLYCSNSCTSLHIKTLKSHIKTLKSHTKTLKIRPKCFGLLSSNPQGVHGRTSLRYWIGMLIYICYKECRYVTVCQFIPSVCVCTYLVDT
jgi:hypothetical protein